MVETFHHLHGTFIRGIVVCLIFPSWQMLIKSLFSGRGGQSALRFARLRMEKRHNYVRKVAEVATQLFITNDKPNIAGLILAGSADFKTELSQSDMFDPVRKLPRNSGKSWDVAC